jgi:hypothetical protein
MELCLALNNLRAALFNKPLLSDEHFSKPFCTALIPILHCICFHALHVCESYPLLCGIVNVHIVYSVGHAF